jgi:hypothetical protein
MKQHLGLDDENGRYAPRRLHGRIFSRTKGTASSKWHVFFDLAAIVDYVKIYAFNIKFDSGLNIEPFQSFRLDDYDLTPPTTASHAPRFGYVNLRRKCNLV